MELNAGLIHAFATSLLWSRYDSPCETPEFHHELWNLACSNHPRVAIAAPRHHAKSTAGTHVLTLASALFQAKRYILIISDSEGQAKEFLGDIKRELVENEDLIELFQLKPKLRKDSETDIIGEFRDGKQFRIVCYGAEQKVRGRKWRGMRPDMVICDDIENDEQVMNEERRHKFRVWFLAALGEIGSDSCHFRVFGTILHQDSLLSHLMPKLSSNTVKTDGLRFWDETFDIESGWHSILYQAHNEDFSKILWPEKYSRKYFEEKRARYIYQGHPELYAQENLNRPSDDSIAYFRKEDLKAIKDPDEFMEFYIGVDLAISTKDQRAYTAMVVAGLTTAGLLKVVDVRRFRGDSLTICDELFSLQTRYNPVMIAMEKENIAKSIGPFLYEQMGREGKPMLNLHLMGIGNQDKIRRAQSIKARIKAGRVEFDHKASWWPSFLEEMIYFPRGSYADQVDALAWIGILLDKMLYVPSEEEKERERYEESLQESDELQDLGLSGYGN